MQIFIFFAHSVEQFFLPIPHSNVETNRLNIITLYIFQRKYTRYSMPFSVRNGIERFTLARHITIFILGKMSTATTEKHTHTEPVKSVKDIFERNSRKSKCDILIGVQIRIWSDLSCDLIKFDLKLTLQRIRQNTYSHSLC